MVGLLDLLQTILCILQVVRISAPNYDEFQGDREIWELLRANPDSVLRVTMAHCDTAGADEIGVADSPDSLARAAVSMGSLRSGSLTREAPASGDQRREGLRRALRA